jgi:hypothetical protein
MRKQLVVSSPCLQSYCPKFSFDKENVTMKSKRLFQIFVVFMLLLSTVASGQPVKAQTNDPIIITRNLSIWDATFIGFVSSSIYEQWHLEFTESHDFTVSVNAVAGDLVPLLILQDASGTEITRGTGSLTSTQPTGSYSVQVQPESGSGFYVLTIRENSITPPPSESVTTSVTPSNINVGETATVTVSLNNVPVEGYTSAEFTCTYDANLVAVSNVAAAGLFGADPATAFNSTQNGSFIFAIAGSHGNKATSSGTAFTFTVTGLQAGQSSVECTARVSKGDNTLTSISSTGAASLTVTGSTPTETPTAEPTDPVTPTPDGSETATPTPNGSETATSTPNGSETATSTPDGSETATSTPDGSVTATLTPDGSETATATQTPDGSATATSTPTPAESPIPTATALPDGTLTGQVLASKPVTVSLYDALDLLVTSVEANPDGTFSLTAPGGTYTVRATADGFLSAEGPVNISSGSTTTMPTLSLLAGDIDGNDVIDQFDALTIGMNYNGSTPAAADLNNDGVINVLDLEVLAGNYRETGPTVWE